MVLMQACKLNLPHSLRSSLEVNSLLFEHSSNTLALMHSDSSILLFPSLSPFSSPSTQSQTLIPPFSSSSCFLRLQSTPNSSSSNTRVIFLVAGPRHGDSRVLLRFWILHKTNNINMFVKAKVSCNQKGFVCDDRVGVLVDLSHGISVKLAGSVNVFAMHSISARKIWVFAAKMIGDEVDSVSVKLMKCAVIDCTIPICSITVSSGFFILGECNGVRIFPLRHIIKGKMKKQRDYARKKEKKTVLQNCGACLENGECGSSDKNCKSVVKLQSVDNGLGGKNIAFKESAESLSNGYTGKPEVNNPAAKHKTLKMKQESSAGGTFFVGFTNQAAQNQKSNMNQLFSVKAVSIHSLSQKKFLILDSVGELHLLDLYSMSPGSEIFGQMRRLSHIIKVQMLAVHPDIYTNGVHSVHAMSVSDVEVSLNENEKSENEEKQLQISAIEAVFASERIQDLIPLSTNAILMLGQGNIYAYAIS
ncbi:hypothetical protein AQUCO_00201113v1 [Aquilegia coerulea]|uniref:Cleavage/polyadenylation specificity factor A subunit N-terminal domain-containing protein n=1 Tax=Aquilegia coerulea TaxID=218851 RepID=A0A2G5F6C8_AQUCA|nr:hypothetical protein AQUCO_00201113v1 [Aquilegia coerulea]